jgi:Trypsin-co-occurring domain 1
MATRARKPWKVEVVGFELGKGGKPGIRDDGRATGDPTGIDVNLLLDAVGDFAEVAGRKLNELDVTPSEFTIEGHVALQVSGGVPVVLQFGVEAGLSISMTWKFEDSTVRVMTAQRKTPPPPKTGRKGVPTPPDDFFKR